VLGGFLVPRTKERGERTTSLRETWGITKVWISEERGQGDNQIKTQKSMGGQEKEESKYWGGVWKGGTCDGSMREII